MKLRVVDKPYECIVGRSIWSLIDDKHLEVLIYPVEDAVNGIFNR